MTTWFITGIARGLGRALAQAALERGDTVVGTVRGEGASFATGTASLHVLDLDLNDTAAIEPTVASAFALAGRIDVVVNNAGYGLLGPIEEASDDDLARLFQVNLFAPFRIVRAAIPRLRAQGGGRIVNVTSVAARAPIASTGLYAAAKAGMEALSHSLAQEVAPFGISVTAVAPGTLRTDFFSDHSIRRTATDGGDLYASTVGRALAAFEAMGERQTGDPVRAAAAILALVDADEPPGHLLLGSDALRRTRAHLDAERREIDRWERLTCSTDAETGDFDE